MATFDMETLYKPGLGTILDKLKNKYSVLDGCIEIRVSSNQLGIADKFVVDLIYPDDKCRTFTANSNDAIHDKLRLLSSNIGEDRVR